MRYKSTYARKNKTKYNFIVHRRGELAVEAKQTSVSNKYADL